MGPGRNRSVHRATAGQTGTLNEIELPRHPAPPRATSRKWRNARETVLKRASRNRGKLTPELKGSRSGRAKDKDPPRRPLRSPKPKKPHARDHREGTRTGAARPYHHRPGSPDELCQRTSPGIYLSDKGGSRIRRPRSPAPATSSREELADNAAYRQHIRATVEKEGVMTSKVRKEFEKRKPSSRTTTISPNPSEDPEPPYARAPPRREKVLRPVWKCRTMRLSATSRPKS